MQISLSELKVNVGKYVDMAENQEVFITRNGKQIAKIVGMRAEKADAARALIGSIKSDLDYEKAREGRLAE